MNITKRIIVIGFIFIFFVPFFGVKKDEGKKPGFAPLNPDFVFYTNSSSKRAPSSISEMGFLAGQVPYPVDLSHIKGTLDKRVHRIYPARYDLREHNKLSPVRDQGRCGSCWTFGVFASMESCLLPGENRDFSEQHLNANHGFDYAECWGGNIYIAAAYLARWGGPYEEFHDKYPYSVGRTTTPTPFLAKHIQKVIFLPNRCGPDVVLENNGEGIEDGYEPVPRDPLGNDTVKWFITNYGAVTVGVYWDSSCYNESTTAFYYNKGTGINHGIAMVGWDDNYSASNFNSQPPGNGAFIMKNSWGQDWGDAGYFYLSYYDTALTTDASFNNTERENNYETIYQYDPFGQTSSFGGVDKMCWGGNIFKAVNTQSLAAVSFFTNDSNVKYEISVYKNVTGNNPVNGLLATQKKGSFIYAGYYTVKLDSLVSLDTGENFSVVVKFTNSGYLYPVPVESPIPDYSSGASANAGESFVSMNGLDWTDLSQYSSASNVCIKAFTTLFPRSIVEIEAERIQERAWLIKKYFGKVTINVKNLAAVPVSRVEIYRKIENETPVLMGEISSNELNNGSYIYYDKYLEEDKGYTYQVRTYDSAGLLCGKSNFYSI